MSFDFLFVPLQKVLNEKGANEQQNIRYQINFLY